MKRGARRAFRRDAKERARRARRQETRTVKKIAIICVVAVADDTPDEYLTHLAGTVSAQVDDPVGDYDEHGNQVLISSAGNSVTLFGAEEWMALRAAIEVGLDGAPEDLPGADKAWSLMRAADL